MIEFIFTGIISHFLPFDILPLNLKSLMNCMRTQSFGIFNPNGSLVGTKYKFLNALEKKYFYLCKADGKMTKMSDISAATITNSTRKQRNIVSSGSINRLLNLFDCATDRMDFSFMLSGKFVMKIA